MKFDSVKSASKYILNTIDAGADNYEDVNKLYIYVSSLRPAFIYLKSLLKSKNVEFTNSKIRNRLAIKACNLKKESKDEILYLMDLLDIRSICSFNSSGVFVKIFAQLDTPNASDTEHNVINLNLASSMFKTIDGFKMVLGHELAHIAKKLHGSHKIYDIKGQIAEGKADFYGDGRKGIDKSLQVKGKIEPIRNLTSGTMKAASKIKKLVTGSGIATIFSQKSKRNI